MCVCKRLCACVRACVCAHPSSVNRRRRKIGNEENTFKRVHHMELALERESHRETERQRESEIASRIVIGGVGRLGHEENTFKRVHHM